MTHRYTSLTRLVAFSGAAAFALGACGSDDQGAIVDGVLTVEMSDFTFGDLPDEVPVGTELAVENTADSELHEFVAFRIADDDRRSAEDIVTGDVGAVLTGGPPAMVHLAVPGSDEQIVVEGDGTFAEPGRYLILCAIPTGVEPGVYLEAAAASEGGPPQVDGGPPHFLNGMYAEITVTT